MEQITFTQSNSRSMRKFNIVQYLLTGIGVFALIFFFSMVDADNIKEYWFMLLIIVLMIIGVFSNLFTKRSSWTRADILFTKQGLLLRGTGKTIPFASINLDIYSEPDGTFSRYVLWDKNKTLAIFSIEDDELLRQLSGHDRKYDISIRQFTVTNVSQNSSYEVSVFTEEGQNFFYNIDTGRYSFKNPEREEAGGTFPEYYVYDPVYVLSSLRTSRS